MCSVAAMKNDQVRTAAKRPWCVSMTSIAFIGQLE
jgi:hypothetical protein